MSTLPPIKGASRSPLKKNKVKSIAEEINLRKSAEAEEIKIRKSQEAV